MLDTQSNTITYSLIHFSKNFTDSLSSATTLPSYYMSHIGKKIQHLFLTLSQGWSWLAILLKS